MDENGVSQADVVRGAGISKTVLSLVLNGKRDLTREHIEALSKYFSVSPAAFLEPA
jgi:HTH-type transcriptional regulator/antitoxin HigA